MSAGTVKLPEESLAVVKQIAYAETAKLGRRVSIAEVLTHVVTVASNHPGEVGDLVAKDTYNA